MDFYEKVKDFSNELQRINDLNGLLSKTVSVFVRDKLVSGGIVFRKDDKFFLKLPDILTGDCIENATIKVITDEAEEIETIFSVSLVLNKRSTKLGEKVFLESIYLIENFKNRIFSSDIESKFRCFIPTALSKLNSFIWQLETVEYSCDWVRVHIDDIQFDILQLKFEKQGYYVIRAIQNMKYEVFADYAYAIQQAIGFITGYMPGGEIYYFADINDFYYTSSIRPALDSSYYPIHTNPYSDFKGTSAEKYYNKLNVLPAKDFSKLVSLIYSNERFSSAIVMMLECASIHSLLIMPSIYAIILEILSKIICNSGEKNQKPIQNKELFRKISNSIYKIIDSFNSEMEPDDDIQKLKRRVPELNKVVKQEYLSNNEKLIRPFEQLGIELSINDINMIKHRNDLLHGNTFLMTDNRKELGEINNYMWYASDKWYTLISLLILKYIGYKGFVINHAKKSENNCHITTDEDYYLFI